MVRTFIRRNFLWTAFIVGILLLALCTFSPLFSAGFLMLDDSFLITDNPFVAFPSLASVLQIFRSYDPELYIPATLLSYQFDRMLGDFSPVFFHLHNIFLHLGSTGLVYWLFLMLTRSKGVSVFIALLFLFHPLQTEAVAWLSARKDLLSSFFALASLATYMSHRSLHGTSRRDVYLLSLVFFFVALLSKVSVAVLPLLLLLIDPPSSRRLFIPRAHIPFWVLGILFALIGFFGKTVALGHMSPAVSIIIACRSFFFILAHFFFPTQLQPLYIVHDWEVSSLQGFLSAVGVLGVLVVTLRSLRKNSVFGQSMSAFLILLLPIGITFWKDGIVYFPSDRYMYLALLPLSLTVLYALRSLCDRFSIKPHRFLLSALAMIILLPCAFLTFKQTSVWQSDTSLFTYVLALEPHSHVALSNLGNTARARGDVPSAIDYYKRAIDSKPDFAIAYRNAGSAFLANKNTLTAQQYYRHAIALSPENPAGYFGLGVALMQSKHFQQAERSFLRVIDLSPTFMDAYIALGGVYYALHTVDKERALYEQGLVIDPANTALRQNLSVLLREKK